MCDKLNAKKLFEYYYGFRVNFACPSVMFHGTIRDRLVYRISAGSIDNNVVYGIEVLILDNCNQLDKHTDLSKVFLNFQDIKDYLVYLNKITKQWSDV